MVRRSRINRALDKATEGFCLLVLFGAVTGILFELPLLLVVIFK